MIRVVLIAFAILIAVSLSSCVIVVGTHHYMAYNHEFSSVVYDVTYDEFVFWFSVPYGSSDIGMARVCRSNVSVYLRSDGQCRTTVRLYGIYDDVRCRYSKAVILVPSHSELQYWQSRIQGGY